MQRVLTPDIAKCDSESSSISSEQGDDSDATMKIVAIAVSSAVVVTVAVVAGVLVWRKYDCCRSRDKTGVDVNEMYGQDEYYQYTESRHQTNIVDENDYYDNDDDD